MCLKLILALHERYANRLKRKVRRGERVWFCIFTTYFVFSPLFDVNSWQESLFYSEGCLLELVLRIHNFNSRKNMGQIPQFLSSLDPFHQKLQSNQEKLDQRSNRDNLDQRFESELKFLNLNRCLHFADGLCKLLTNRLCLQFKSPWSISFIQFMSIFMFQE